MLFKKKKKDLKIQDISSDCPDYSPEPSKSGKTGETENISGEQTDQNEENSKKSGKGEERKIKKEKKRKMKEVRKRRRNPFLGILMFLLVLVAVASGVYFWGIPLLGGNTLVYVEKVSNIMGLGSGNGTLNRYAGIVESQGEWTVKVDGDKSVKEVYVNEGDNVAIGDKLFAYDTEEIQLSLQQAKLELERMESEIASDKSQISSLESQKSGASSSEQLDYEVQIQSLKASNKKLEYEMKSQQATIESLEKAAQDTVVKSEMSGVVKKIDQSVISGGTVGETTFITILATGDYRIKASVNEQNQWSIEEGAAVIVRSRVDDTVKWTGTIVTVNLDEPEDSDTSSYSDSSEMTTSSSYPFYVKLDSSDGLLLGQHVYVELDNGQEEEKEGVWLEGYYLVQDEDKTYVWAENSLHLLEKREVTLGEFDEELGKYEIVSGLALDDYIAFPTDGMMPWARTTRETEDGSSTNSSNQADEEFQMEDDSFQEFDDNDGSSSDGDSEEDLGPVGSIEGLTEVFL